MQKPTPHVTGLDRYKGTSEDGLRCCVFYSYLSREEVVALFEAARGDWLEAFFVVPVLSGLRIGELLGLKWEDVDFDGQTLKIH